MVKISDIAKEIVDDIVNRFIEGNHYSNEKDLYYTLMSTAYLEGMKIKKDNPTKTVEDIVNRFNKMDTKPYESGPCKTMMGYVQFKDYEILRAELSELYLEGVKMQSENPNEDTYRIFESVSYGLAVERVST